MIVLDASAAVEWILWTPLGEIIDRRIGVGNSLHAPYLLDIEITHAIRGLVFGGAILAARATQVIEDLKRLRIMRYPHTDLLSRVWELRENLTAYDAVYVALAESLGARLVTCDAKMAASPRHKAEIDFVREGD